MAHSRQPQGRLCSSGFGSGPHYRDTPRDRRLWVCDEDRRPGTHSVSVASSDIDPDANSNTYAHTDSNADSNPDSDIYADPDTDSNTTSDTDSNANSDSNSNSDIYTYTYSDANSNACAEPHADPGNFHRDAGSHGDCSTQPHRNPSGRWHCSNHRRDQQQLRLFRSAFLLPPVIRTL